MKAHFKIQQATIGKPKSPSKKQRFEAYEVSVKKRTGWVTIGSKFTEIVKANNYIHTYMEGRAEEKKPSYFTMKWTTEL